MTVLLKIIFVSWSRRERGQDSCNGPVDEMVCSYLVCPVLIGGVVVVFSSLAMAFERVCATLFYKSYEQVGAKSAGLMTAMLVIQVHYVLTYLRWYLRYLRKLPPASAWAS